MKNIKSYSFVKHNRYDFGIIMLIDRSDNTALVVYFERYFSSFNPVFLNWVMVDDLEIIKDDDILKEMYRIKERAKKNVFLLRRC